MPEEPEPALPAAASAGPLPAAALVPLDPGPLTPLPPAPTLPPAAHGPQPESYESYDYEGPTTPQPPPLPQRQAPPPAAAQAPAPASAGPSGQFPQLPITGTHDLRLEPLPPPIDPAETNPMPVIGAPQGPEPDLSPLPPARTSADLPQLSAPHLRVTPMPGQPVSRGPLTPPPAVPTPSFPPAAGSPLPPPGTGVGGPAGPVGPVGPVGPGRNGPGGPGGNGPGARPTDPGPDRTSGGLVKRAPRTAFAGGSGGGSTQPARPSDDLLQTLATYTTHLHRQINPNAGPPPITGSGPGPFPPFNPTPPPGTPAVRSGGAGFPPRGGQHGTPTMHSSTGPHTASGLTRRVAGAQMPRTQPIGLRSREPITGPVTSPAGGPAPAPGPGHNRDHRGTNDGRGQPGGVGSNDAAARDQRSAKDVYSFLSSFSAGVQRGLDEARNPATSEEDQ